MGTPRLLILGCSSRKRLAAETLPALERYNGPAFGVLRKFLRTGRSDVRVCILSARYGLMDADTPIPFYDERMTALRARELRGSVLASLIKIVQRGAFETAFFDLSREYWAAVEGWQVNASPTMHHVVAQGSSGRRAAMLREWLRGESENATPFFCAPGEVHLGGRVWHLKRQEIFAIARQRLRECDETGSLAPARFHSWHVRVDRRSVAPKWLVSQITGLPPSAFHTEQACQALTRWGLRVERQSLLESPSREKTASEV